MADYRPDYRGAAKGLVSPEMQRHMEAVAAEAIPFARSISPDATPIEVGYIASFVVEGGTSEVTTRSGRSRRSTATLSNTSDHAIIVENGRPAGVDSRGRAYPAQDGHHVLGRTIDHIEGR